MRLTAYIIGFVIICGPFSVLRALNVNLKTMIEVKSGVKGSSSPGIQESRQQKGGKCYEYAFAGGCSSNKEEYPRWKNSKSSSLNDCKAYCEGEPECHYFEYEPSTTWCHLHKSDITKGNNYSGVKCYKMSRRQECQGTGLCEEVTVGGCNLKGVIETYQLNIDESECQVLCYTSTDCAVYQHKEDTCTLLREDYRQDCQTSGGLRDNSIDACLAVDLYTCDRFLEEDCVYTGEVILTKDDVADAKHCQILCQQLQSTGCQYWVFQLLKNEENKHECVLLKSTERKCSTKGGPRSPSLAECLLTTTEPTKTSGDGRS